MVHEKSKHLLSEVYSGRLNTDLGDNGAFSDVYTMKRMSKEHPGKMASASTSTGGPSPFQFVSESNMDFENYKNHPGFNDDGETASLYGGRPDTPNSHRRGRSESRDSERTNDEPGVMYPAGYHSTPSALREMSPSPEPGLRRLDSSDGQGLMGSAAPMGVGNGQFTPYSPERDGEGGYFRR
jgi:hypothetical protein